MERWWPSSSSCSHLRACRCLVLASRVTAARLRDELRARPAREGAERPPDEDDEPVLDPEEIEEVHEEPRDPRGESTDLEALDASGRLRAADGRDVALVDVGE